MISVPLIQWCPTTYNRVFADFWTHLCPPGPSGHCRFSRGTKITLDFVVCELHLLVEIYLVVRWTRVPARPGKKLRGISGNRSGSFGGGSAPSGRGPPPPPPRPPPPPPSTIRPILLMAAHGAKQWDMASWRTTVGFPWLTSNSLLSFWSPSLRFIHVWTSHCIAWCQRGALRLLI